MAQYTKKFVQDLQKDIKIRQCGSIAFNTDDLSNVISVDLYDGGEPAVIGGTVYGAVICSDGTTVPITNGTISGNTVSITLTAACFEVLGAIEVGIQLITGGVKTTILKAIYNVLPLETETVIDPDSRIALSVGDLVDEIADAVASIPADYDDLLAGIADVFSTDTAYIKGKFVWYDGKLYRFKNNHSAGAWSSADVDAVALTNYIWTATDDGNGNITIS